VSTPMPRTERTPIPIIEPTGGIPMDGPTHTALILRPETRIRARRVHAMCRHQGRGTYRAVMAGEIDAGATLDS
jgi:hypothetical protein